MENQFSSSDLAYIFRKKYVVIIGDSIHRSIYKDLVLFIQRDRYLTYLELKTKGEGSFLNDELIEGGTKDGANNGIDYREMRRFKMGDHHIRFYFVTRCYNSYVKSILMDLCEEPLPDLIIMNSGLWDVSRYGKDSLLEFKSNLVSLFCEMNKMMPDDCLILWNTTPPVSSNARGGFLPTGEEFKHTVLNSKVTEANSFAEWAADGFNIHIVDLHSYLCNHCELQVNDGIHWDMVAHRLVTNLILERLCYITGMCPPSHRTGPRFHRNRFNVNHFPNAIANSVSPPSRHNLYDFQTPRRPMPHYRNLQSQSPCPSPFPLAGGSLNNSFLASPLNFQNSFYQTPSPCARGISGPGILPVFSSLFGCLSQLRSSFEFRNSSQFSEHSIDLRSPGFFTSPGNSPIQPYPPSRAYGQSSRYAESPPVKKWGSGTLPCLGEYSQQVDHFGAIRHNVRGKHAPYKRGNKN